MRIMTVALGTALVLCSLETFSAAAHARKAKVVREPRPIIRVTPNQVNGFWELDAKCVLENHRKITTKRIR
jgi:hypothetical protein